MTLPVPLKSHEAHLWFVYTDHHYEQYLEYRALLTDQEIEREEKFRTEILKKKFTISRGILRLLLQSYNQKVEGVDFCYGEHGKPFLRHNPNNLQFNLAHSHDLIIYGFLHQFQIGVDIEYIRDDFLPNDLVNYVFSDSEKKDYNTLKDSEKKLAFYHAWTRKEAFVKAIGKGLFQSLEKIEITFKIGDKPKILSFENDFQVANDWSLHSLKIAPEYVGAVVCQAPSVNLKIFDYQ